MSTNVYGAGDFRVNSYTAGDQTMSSVTALKGGGFVVTWASNGQDGAAYGVYGQRYDASGVRIGSEFQVNNIYTNNSQSEPSVTALTGGGFVVTWSSFGQDGSDGGIYAQRYDAAGNRVGSELHVNAWTTGHQGEPSVAALANGGFVIGWASAGTSWEPNGQDGSYSGIYAQRYDAGGNRIGSELPVNTYTNGDQVQPSITGLKSGGFIVT